ncbi:MAG: CDGSH iron-sulfur domain-containing protein [Anaerolineae bacterium]
MKEPQTGLTLKGEGGLTIIVGTNDSYEIKGPFTILNDAGDAVFQAEEEWFCRCGHSSNKPF